MPELTPYPEFVNVGVNLTHLTVNQKKFIESIRNNVVTIGYGTAGSGKTYCSLAEGFRQYFDDKQKRKINEIIFIRPAVEAEEELGFLPGSLDDKIDPFMAPLEISAKKLLKGNFDRGMKIVRRMTMAFLRGLTFDNCYVILDEAQNTTMRQMKLFLSRIGRNCKVVVVGDTSQSDICDRPGVVSGLADAVSRLKTIKGLSVCEFGYSDTMRSYIVDKILRAYDGLPVEEAKEAFDIFMDENFGDPDDVELLDVDIIKQLQVNIEGNKKLGDGLISVDDITRKKYKKTKNNKKVD
jgi:phosphate starvation-inducible PhoH-like protein